MHDNNLAYTVALYLKKHFLLRIALGLCGGILALFFLVVCTYLYVGARGDWPLVLKILYGSLGKDFGIFAINLLLIPILLGRFKPFHVIFSTEFLSLLSRISYPTFLLMPVTMISTFYQLHSMVVLGSFNMAYYGIGNLFISAIGGYLITLFFMQPLDTLRTIWAESAEVQGLQPGELGFKFKIVDKLS